MKNNELKEKIRKNIKEEIAISNIRKEFDMRTNKNQRIVYAISSICAVFILGVGIFVGTSKLNNNLFQNKNLEIGKEENLNIKLNIDKLKDMTISKIDADIKTIEIKELPEKFQFMNNVKIPKEYKMESSYNIFTREGQKNNGEYNVLHDYVFYYRKDSMNSITIAFSEIEKPLRDCYIEGTKNISKIGDVELIISQWKEMYIVTFKHKDIYFDIETTGITENQLIDLLVSIIGKY